MKYPKLFDEQPEITEVLLMDFEKRGLIVSEKSIHNGKRRVVEVSNPTAGDIVGYALLSVMLRNGKIDQLTARLLLTIEATRAKGPRETHITRLISKAFTTDKKQVLKKLESWAKNH